MTGDALNLVMMIITMILVVLIGTRISNIVSIAYILIMTDGRIWGSGLLEQGHGGVPKARLQ